MVKCLLCGFTADTGDLVEDSRQLSNHWMTHSKEEKDQYFAIQDQYLAEFPQDKHAHARYGWRNRIQRIETDLLRLGDAVDLMKEKMSAEERTLFKTDLVELFVYWDHFKRIYDGCVGSGW
jgi:hypothetical protein